MSKEKNYTVEEAIRMCLDGYVMDAEGDLFRWDNILRQFDLSVHGAEQWRVALKFPLRHYKVYRKPPKEPEPFSEERLRDMLFKLYGGKGCVHPDFIEQCTQLCLYLRNAK